MSVAMRSELTHNRITGLGALLCMKLSYRFAARRQVLFRPNKKGRLMLEVAFLLFQFEGLFHCKTRYAVIRFDEVAS